MTALIEASPLNPASWEVLADKVRRQNDPLSIKSLDIIITGLKKVEELNELAGVQKIAPPRLSSLSQSMFVRLSKAYNSPTLLKEVGLIYLRDLSLPDVALKHFERSLLLGGPEKELRPLTEAAAVAVQRQLTQRNGQEPALSGITTAQHAKPVATNIIRKTGKLLLPARFSQTSTTKLSPHPAVESQSSESLPPTTRECLDQAQAAIIQGALTQAESLLRHANRAPAKAEEMWQAWTDLGQAYYERGDFLHVEAAFSEALQHNPGEMASHFNVALGYHLNQRFEQAIAAYAKANDLEKRHPKVWCNLGVLYFQMDAYEQAEAALRYAVMADPQYARAWDNLAASLGAQDKLDEAIASCRRALDLKSDYPEAYFKIGVIYFSKNELEKAADEFHRAIALPPLIPYCHAFLAMIHARLEKPEEAEAAVLCAAQADPACELLWMAWNDLGLAWYSEKNYERAAQAYKQATLLKPDEAEAWLNLGISHHQHGDFPAARDSYRRAIELNAAFAGAWHNLGNVCAELGHLEEAVAAFRKETHLAPNNMRAWYDLGVTFEKLAYNDDARIAFARAEALEAAQRRATSAPAGNSP